MAGTTPTVTSRRSRNRPPEEHPIEAIGLTNTNAEQLDGKDDSGELPPRLELGLKAEFCTSYFILEIRTWRSAG
jgi:hypothetical protein